MHRVGGNTVTRLTSRAKAHKGPDDAIAEDGGLSLCPRGMGMYSHGDSKVSVHVGERGGEIKQVRRYRHESVVLHIPIVERRRRRRWPRGG